MWIASNLSEPEVSINFNTQSLILEEININYYRLKAIVSIQHFHCLGLEGYGLGLVVFRPRHRTSKETYHLIHQFVDIHILEKYFNSLT